jgi:hypothetical protein
VPSPEDSRRAETERTITDQVKLAKTGLITKVYEHRQPDDVWNYHVDVRISPNNHPRRVPVATPMPELIAPPRSPDHDEGPDLALVQFLDDDDEPRPIVTHIMYNDQDRPPLGYEGGVKLRRGQLYFEMDSSGEYARLAKRPENDRDDSQPTEVVEIDDQNEEVSMKTDPNDDGSYENEVIIDDQNEVSLKTDIDGDGSFEMKVTLDISGGQIKIETDNEPINIKSGDIVNVHTKGGKVKLGDENGTFDPVARKGDTVSGTTSDGASFSTTIDEGSSEVESS